MKVAFTGHRPEDLGGYGPQNPLKDWIVSQISFELGNIQAGESEEVEIISGMALGVDTWAAELAVKLLIPFYAYIPFKGQELIWPEAAQKVYRELLALAKKVEVICPGGYSPAKMQRRNEAMVDDCDVLIAVWNGKETGGTWNCLKYARKCGTRIIHIDPNDFSKETK